MSSDDSVSKAAVEAVPKLVALLEPLPPEGRERAISAAMILLGASSPSLPYARTSAGDDQIKHGEGISAKALVWMQRSSIMRNQLEQVFSIEEDAVHVIARKVPGKSKREQTLEAYLLCGLQSYLRTGEPAFADNDARDLCERMGCFDGGNHSNFTKAFGNLIHGSKSAGWKVTNPGLDRASQIVRELAGDNGA